MSNVITIENTEMQIREYNGQCVVTFKDIDTVHNRPSGTAKRNFARNKKHFIESEDFFTVTKNDVGTNFVPTYGFNEKASSGILLTETGYLMLVKSLKDDLSWKIQRRLVNAYFKVKNEPEQTDISDSTEITEHRIPVRTATTPVPLQSSFYQRYRRKMDRVANRMNCSSTYIYSQVLKRVNESYDLDKCEKLFVKETGHAPNIQWIFLHILKNLGKLAVNL